MNSIKDLIKITAFALCATVMFASCSDDDNNGDTTNEGSINPTNVFTGKRVNNLNGSIMTYNQDGLLTQLKNSEELVTFTYQTATRNAGTHVKMTISYPNYPQDGKMYIDMTIGKNGFVESAVETYEKDNGTDTWRFEYDSEGHLNYMKRSEGGKETTNITYTNGDITRVEMTSELDDSNLNAQISYGSTPIENKGCLMLFDTTFGIDMDEMKYAYWAGLLGKATKHLPISCIEGDEEKTFSWLTNDEGYPKSMSYKDGGMTETYTFNW